MASAATQQKTCPECDSLPAQYMHASDACFLGCSEASLPWGSLLWSSMAEGHPAWRAAEAAVEVLAGQDV
jgi:hypothetical protein